VVNRVRFLQDFIDQSLSDYVEPTREGTARGERIGYSRQKFHASILMALSSLKEKEIAQRLKVSYGLTRQWSIDREFSKMMQQHVVDFGTYFEEEILKLADRLEQTYMNPPKLSRDELLNPKHPIHSYEIADASLFGPGAEIGVCTELYSANKKKSLFFSMEAYRIVAALKLSFSRSHRTWMDSRYKNILRLSTLYSGSALKKGMPSANIETAVNFMERVVLDGTAELLRQPKVSHEQTQMAGFLLSMLSREVGFRLIEKKSVEKEKEDERWEQEFMTRLNKLSEERKE